MRKLALAVALAAALALGAAAGPALSLSRYRPDPLDFELAPASSSDAGVLRAPKRFNLLGLRWRGQAEPGIRLRVHTAGGSWGRWVAVGAHAEHEPDPGRNEPAAGASDPVWAGEADAVQYRLSRRVPGLRLHFVNVEGSATPADRARTALRRSLNTALVSVASVLRSPKARAAGPRPAIVPRSGWNAGQCPPREAPDYGTVKTAFVHHTVNANDYTREEAPDIVLAICRYHRNSNGWNDIGYNFLVDRFGTIYEGRAGGVDAPVVGAQAQGYNAQSTGVANIGTFSDVPQTHDALVAMARLIRWKLPISGAPTYGYTTLVSAGGSSNRYPSGAHVRVRRVIGHRDTGQTECPGNALYNQLPELRSLVGNLAAVGAATSLTARFAPRKLRYRGRSRVRGRLLSSSGSPMAGERILVQARRRGAWRSVARARTDSGGRFGKVVRPRSIVRVRARFPGRAGVLGASSRRTRLLVRAVVRLREPPERASVGAPVLVRGRVGPRSRRLVLVVQRRRDGEWRRVLRRSVRARHGRMRVIFTPRHRGRYRYYLVAIRDRVALAARTRKVILRVSRNVGGAKAPR
ncbi:MAG: peptidoglycan recognition protein [Thermoleophilaceae bacterium]